MWPDRRPVAVERALMWAEMWRLRSVVEAWPGWDSIGACCCRCDRDYASGCVNAIVSRDDGRGLSSAIVATRKICSPWTRTMTTTTTTTSFSMTMMMMMMVMASAATSRCSSCGCLMRTCDGGCGGGGVASCRCRRRRLWLMATRSGPEMARTWRWRTCLDWSALNSVFFFFSIRCNLSVSIDLDEWVNMYYENTLFGFFVMLVNLEALMQMQKKVCRGYASIFIYAFDVRRELRSIRT